MNAATCVCQKVLNMSISALHGMSAEMLENYWNELRAQQGCVYPKTLADEIQRCEKELDRQAGDGDKWALHWKLNATLHAKGQKNQKCKI